MTETHLTCVQFCASFHIRKSYFENELIRWEIKVIISIGIVFLNSQRNLAHSALGFC